MQQQRMGEVDMELVLKQNRKAPAMRILVTENSAQEGIDLLRTHLPNAQIDVRLDLTAEQIRAEIGQYTALVRTGRRPGA
jgi:hypothetical protein